MRDRGEVTGASRVLISYWGLPLDAVALRDVGPTTGYVVVEQPMPVGSSVQLAAGDLVMQARVVHVDERGEGVALPGMRLALVEASEPAQAWWSAQRSREADPVPLAQRRPEGASSALVAPAAPAADADARVEQSDAQRADEAAPAHAAAGGDGGNGMTIELEADEPSDKDRATGADGAVATPTPEAGSGASRTQMMAAVDLDAIERLGSEASIEEFAEREREAAAAMYDAAGEGQGEPAVSAAGADGAHEADEGAEADHADDDDASDDDGSDRHASSGNQELAVPTPPSNGAAHGKAKRRKRRKRR